MAALLNSSYAPWNWGEDFRALDGQTWWSEHEEYPMMVIGLYVCMVFKGPSIMSKFPLHPTINRVLKLAFILWNLALSTFSWVGLSFAVPHLLHHLADHGFYYTVCTPPAQWYATGKVAFWVEMFVLSKFPELLDTVFLVVQSKRVIFLHWYHHVTVLLFCWQAYIRDAAPGLWYCSMNYSVHAFMYLYYAAMAIPATRKLAARWSIFITIAQISQMVMGAVVTMSAAWLWARGSDCHMRQSTCCLGVVMYVSYFYLFVALFVEKYCCGGQKSGGKGERPKGDATVSATKELPRLLAHSGQLSSSISFVKVKDC